jgi:4-hydroxythreonine-4-phosphate dehydrogenase
LPLVQEPEQVGEQGWLATPGPAAWEMGRAQAECGRAALAALERGAGLARARRVGALVTGPVSKEALHLAGERVEGQSELLARWDGAPNCQMLAVAGELRVLLLTRHLPLKDALAEITAERVVLHLEILRAALAGLGIERPRLALAGLNPHAGEGGILGREEIGILAPAAATARERGILVDGPLSPDTVFAQAAKGRFDGVLALYHDQAFIPIKLLAPDTGLTVLAGLSYLRISPVHGTAFDIAGRGVASHANLTAALMQAARWARRGFGPGPRGTDPRESK